MPRVCGGVLTASPALDAHLAKKQRLAVRKACTALKAIREYHDY